MPVLRNQKHELLAQELAKGKTATEAMETAGYSDPRNSTRLTKNDEIRQRVDELQGRAAEKAEVTVQSLLDEAETARSAAMEAGQFSAAIQAIREKGVLSGRRVERSERGQPGEFESMNADELRASIARDLETIGRQDLAASLVGGKGTSRRELN